MEKISGIVRGNARTASVDLKSMAPVRPGAPSFGGPVGTSTAGNSESLSTARKALALHSQMEEAKKVRGEDQTVQILADQFFMSRIRRPPDEEITAPGNQPSPLQDPVTAPIVDTGSGAVPSEEPIQNQSQTSGYTPRGSYVDVRA
ncbi:MAG: hypothetical protein AB7G93_20145 [Bdellovibrionales bacterium]